MEFLLICFAVLTTALFVGYGIHKRREEWRHDNWAECYHCGRVGYVAGWRALRAGTEDRLYIAAPACARCRQARESDAEQEKDRKVAFFPWRSAAEDLAEQMNDDVRFYGKRKTAYAPEA